MIKSIRAIPFKSALQRSPFQHSQLSAKMCARTTIDRGMSSNLSSNKCDVYLERARQCVPLLTNSLHKGQAGRIGVVGGSFEYTGAPYFAAISGLKVGADLLHVFCSREAAIPIKSYSPELMVHPVLDANNAIELINPWLERLDVVVIGPGLGRDANVFKTIEPLLGRCRELKKPLVLDADALFLISQNVSLIAYYPAAILTPNVVEFNRIFGDSDFAARLNAMGPSVTVIKKGFVDTVYGGENKVEDAVSIQGGNERRCGGQGDILSGCIAVFYAWALKAADSEPATVACVAASHFVKKLNSFTFESKGRSMTATDMIANIHQVFDEHFEHK